MLEAKSRVISRQAEAYLEAVAAKASALSPSALAVRVTSLTDRHDEWRATECLNLNPAETVISRSARRLLDSDLDRPPIVVPPTVLVQRPPEAWGEGR